ncbi:hypothetical protein WOLCODRAFT_82816, partial [Wolfiporia cocos MD-104 SS10]
DAARATAALIRYLGGPEYSGEDFEWAANTPAGNAILQWLANQSAAHIPGVVKDVSQLWSPAVLEHIALYDEEVAENHHESVQPETELLEKETEALKRRLHSAKLASKQLSRAIKQLQSFVNDTTDEASCYHHQLGELSIQADSSISRSCNSAAKLLGKWNCSPTEAETKGICNTNEQHLKALGDLRSSIVESTEKCLQRVNAASRSLPQVSELERDVTTLLERHQHLIKHRVPQIETSVPPQYTTKLYCKELDHLSEQLEHAQRAGNQEEILQRILDDAESATDNGNGGVEDVDIMGEIQRAWVLDQRALLYAREDILDQAISAFEKQLHPPLQTLYERVSQSGEFVAEAEALIGALLEERGEIAADVAAAQQPPPHSTDIGTGIDESAQVILETELKDLLKRLQQQRPQDAGPLVLLDHSDLLKELRCIANRLKIAEDNEAEWLSSAPSYVQSLAHSHEPLISTVYANSPVNTSPPFAPGPDLQKLEKRTRQRSERLYAAMVKLQKAQINDRDRRKLSAFVGEWT